MYYGLSCVYNFISDEQWTCFSTITTYCRGLFPAICIRIVFPPCLNRGLKIYVFEFMHICRRKQKCHDRKLRLHARTHFARWEIRRCHLFPCPSLAIGPARYCNVCALFRKIFRNNQSGRRAGSAGGRYDGRRR